MMSCSRSDVLLTWHGGHAAYGSRDGFLSEAGAHSRHRHRGVMQSLADTSFSTRCRVWFTAPSLRASGQRASRPIRPALLVVRLVGSDRMRASPTRRPWQRSTITREEKGVVDK